jgi:4-alpha-glucanotransferase
MSDASSAARLIPFGPQYRASGMLLHITSSPAALAIAPLQDFLSLGAEARMNLPGSTEGNWRWRCTDEKLSELVFERLYELTTTTDRHP